MRRQRDWALRMTHESVTHTQSCFITLTYDEEHLPEDGGLRVKDWQDFAKRMRKGLGPFRFFHCGEYGDQFGRPHYHAAIFGQDFRKDRTSWKSRNGTPSWRSEALRELWGHGDVEIADLTFGSAAYVAGYIVKKITGEEGKTVYRRCDERTGESWPVAPPYATMSRRPGLGRAFYDRFKSDLYPSDFCVSDGRKYPVPEYYDKLLEEDDPEMMERVRRKRAKHARNDSPKRMKELEKNHTAVHDFFAGRVAGGMHPTASF